MKKIIYIYILKRFDRQRLVIKKVEHDRQWAQIIREHTR